MTVSRQIEIEAAGIVYRNPRPQVRAVHAWHPRLCAGAHGRVFVTYDLGQAVESLDYRTYISHSDDGGRSWSSPVRLYEDNLLPVSPRPTTHLARPSRMRDGDLVAVIGRYFRDDTNAGIINHANLGLVDMELFLARSGNDGRTWQPPQRIVPPVTGTGFEVAHPILELRDGRWMAPLATWHYGNSTPPYGDKAIAFVSTDQGRTWPTYLDVMDESAQGIIYFEQGLAELADGRVLAVAWAFDGKKGTTRSIDWAVSDGGAFTPFKRTCLAGETAKLIALPNGSALCVYRGINPAGLCASLLDVQGDELRSTEPVVLWKGERTQMVGAASAGEELANLKLGSPHMIALDQDRVLVVFWCCIEGVFHIRWIRAKISNPCPGAVNPDHAASPGAAGDKVTAETVGEMSRISKPMSRGAGTASQRRSGHEIIMQVRPPHTIPRALPAEQFKPERVEQWVARCADLGVTAILWYVHYVGKATYHSNVLPRMTPLSPRYFQERGIGPGVASELFFRIGAALERFDTLDIALAAAKTHGIALYADLAFFDQYFPGLESRFFEEHPELWLRGRLRRRPTQMYSQTMPEPYQRLVVQSDLYQPGQTWFRGLPCYAEPDAQDYWLSVIRELMERGVQAFAFNFTSHVQTGFGNTWRVIDGDEGPDSFGFNPPVVAEYRKRYGADVLTEPFERAKLRDLHGEFFTMFLRRIRQTIGPSRRLLAATTVDGECGYGADLAQFRMKLDWRQWIEQGIADDLLVFSQSPTAASVEQVQRRIKSQLSKGRVFVWRELNGSAQNPVTNLENFAAYRKELDNTCAGALDGYGFKELARIAPANA